MKNILSALIFCIITSYGITQDVVEYIDTLYYDESDNTLRKRLKYVNQDTLIEIYTSDGKIDYKRQVFNKQYNGYSKYYYSEKISREENYTNGLLDGKTTVYDTNGTILSTDNYYQNMRVDTSTYFERENVVSKKVIYITPCKLGSSSCNQKIITYRNGQKVYSYLVDNGWKTDKVEVYNNELYNSMMDSLNNRPITEKGLSVYRVNCASCHKIDKRLIGPALGQAILNKSKKEFVSLLEYANHNNVKITKEEIEQLYEYLKSLQ